MLFPDKNELSEAIKVGVGVLEKVADINSLMLQCHQYFNKLQALAEARISVADEAEQYRRAGRDVGAPCMGEDYGIDGTNVHVFGEWDDFSGIADVFTGSLLPEFDPELFAGL
jgi:hypothetical protein